MRVCGVRVRIRVREKKVGVWRKRSWDYLFTDDFFFVFFAVLCTSKHSSTVEDPVDAVHTSIWNNKGVFRDLLANNETPRLWFIIF